MKDPNEEITLLIDVKTKKPGCVILQAIAGLAHNNRFLQETFTNWETNITDDMRKITGTRAQWEKLADKTNNER